MSAAALDNGGPDDDIFGGGRSYGSSFCGGNGAAVVTKARPTMISAKYRLKEERRKVLKISINKLKKIEDMESSLRRSVLINNTIKRLQREAKEEKLQKQQLHAYPRCFTPYNKAARHDGVPSDADKENTSQNASRAADPRADSLLLLPGELDLSLSRGCDEEAALSPPAAPKKRPVEEVEDCDVQDVLSQFYMPPTPRMLTSIDDTDDEDEDVNVVDIDVPPCAPVAPDCCKRPRLQLPEAKPDAACERLRPDERTLPARTLEDQEDIEVVLEDKEDVERRLLLCSGGTTISRTAVPEDRCWVNSRTNGGGSSCTLLPSPSDMLVEDCAEGASDPSSRLACSDSSPLVLPVQSAVLSEHSSNIARHGGAPGLSTMLSPPPSDMDTEEGDAANHPVLRMCDVQQSPPSDMLVDDSLPAGVDCRPDPRLAYSSPPGDMLVPASPAQASQRFRSPADLLMEEPDLLVAGKHQALRLGGSPFAASSFCGSLDGDDISGGSPLAMEPAEQHQYSCGHASIFGELQSVVFHSLIASLES
ncbi:uncharacterized protein LOC134534729 [Bacillus rossius redtenbacheri]|uniref:uncharacterized protein LOC134534729 n=1 Tax=Bacillus rossius redtenbacheri TaxID=93214 RepID=UPI002FDD6891